MKDSDACILYLGMRRESNRVLFSCRSAHPNSPVLLQISLGGGWFHCLGLGELFASLTEFIGKVANACFRIWRSAVGEASGNVAVCCVGTLVPSVTVT